MIGILSKIGRTILSLFYIFHYYKVKSIDSIKVRIWFLELYPNLIIVLKDFVDLWLNYLRDQGWWSWRKYLSRVTFNTRWLLLETEYRARWTFGLSHSYVFIFSSTMFSSECKHIISENFSYALMQVLCVFVHNTNLLLSTDQCAPKICYLLKKMIK